VPKSSSNGRNGATRAFAGISTGTDSIGCPPVVTRTIRSSSAASPQKHLGHYRNWICRAMVIKCPYRGPLPERGGCTIC
jgi:hypothetical protein